MMKLERNWQLISEKLFSVFSPDDKGIGKAAVHVYNTVNFSFDYCRGTYMISSEKGISQEQISPLTVFTMVLTAILSYCISLPPTGRR